MLLLIGRDKDMGRKVWRDKGMEKGDGIGRKMKMEVERNFPFFFLQLQNSTMLHLPALRFHCVGGYRDLN